MERDDLELIARAREGDLDAFAELVRRHERGVRAVITRLIGDERDVEEAAQDVFVQAWRSLDAFREESSFFTWLYRIAVNEALMRLRRNRPATAELVEADEPGVSPADESSMRDVLLASIAELPFEERAALLLRDLHGLSNQEVADTLGVSLGAAKSRVHRARMQVRAALEEWESG
jgi:RNA polymerase sigma-70 factor (ECF subfamily)